MQHANTQAITYLRPSALCRPGEERQGGLARSTELLKEGRPGSRLAVTFNLDLVSIGVLGPVPRRSGRSSTGARPLNIYPIAPGRND